MFPRIFSSALLIAIAATAFGLGGQAAAFALDDSVKHAIRDRFPPPPVTTTVEGEELIEEVQSDIAADEELHSDDPNLAIVRSFYAKRDYAPFWVDREGPTRKARQLVAMLSTAGDWGLDQNDYALPAYKAERIDGAWTASQVANIEVELWKKALLYAHEARGGRIPNPTEQLSSYIDRKPRLPDPGDVIWHLSNANNTGAALLWYQPQHAQFIKLHRILKREREKRADDEPDYSLPPSGPMLSLGNRHPDVITLRQRFALTSVSGNENLFDRDVRNAVIRFQAQNGLTRDGYVGRRTRWALSNRADDGTDLQKIIANMEAWRWMPAELGDRHIMVNIPTFTLSYVHGGETALTERVIVGELAKQTPIFSHPMKTAVLRPQWIMPDSIKVDKIMSASRRNRTLESMGYQIKKGRRVISSSSVDWSTANLSAYTIYEPSGAGNALGYVKFLFPNKHAVYLHDTPSKSLFNSASRTFSHGCIRLRNPLEFAQILLDDDKGKGVINVKNQVRRGQDSNAISLQANIPVHVVHFTAWVDDEDNLQTYRDVYGHERRIRLALKSKWRQIDRGRDHLAKVDTSRLKSIGRIAEVEFPPPMGVVSASNSGFFFKPNGYRSSRNSVGDLIRRRFGGF